MMRNQPNWNPTRKGGAWKCRFNGSRAINFAIGIGGVNVGFAVDRPVAIYDAAAAAQTFTDGEMVDSEVGNGEFSKIEVEGNSRTK